MAAQSPSSMMRVNKSPADRYSYQNCVVISSSNTELKGAKHLLVNGKPLKVEEHVGRGLAQDEIGLSGKQRTWLNTNLTQLVEVKKFKVDKYIAKMTVELDFFGGRQPKKVPPPLNTDKLMEGFQEEFSPSTVFSEGQDLVVQMSKHVEKSPVMEGRVLSIELMGEASGGKSAIPVKHGLIVSNTIVLFEKREGSTLEFVGSKKGEMLAAQTAIINPDWDFKQMGIGGLHKEFSDIFRRAFASRVFPPELIEKLGMKHVRGILLFGPPGTGKTLMARQIGNMLHARPPKIINGPEILNKYVGESESNIRLLFAEAEKEEKERGINSALHLIIFDEIDAICRARGSLSGSTGVHDTVVNQLLAKMDGVEQLNNILLIGMTNRKDMIDEALLRPGRLEVQMEIGLPDQNGRFEILLIHTAKLREHKKLAEDVDIDELAKATRNFSGAEIEGLVRSAESTAMNRIIAGKNKIEVSADDAAKLRISKADFDNALLHDIKPAYGVSEEDFDRYVRSGIIEWGPPVQDILDRGKLAVRQTEESLLNNLTSLLLKGRPGSGKTALAVEIAKESKFPFIKIISLENMVGFNEGAKSQAIKKVFDDAHKSPVSCIIIDAIERLLDYVVIGPRFSNLVLQTLLVLVNKNPPLGHRLLILGTTSLAEDVLSHMELSDVFQFSATVPYLTKGEEVVSVLKEASIFTGPQLQEIAKKIAGKKVNVGVKKLLAMANSSSLTENEVAHFMAQLYHEAHLP